MLRDVDNWPGEPHESVSGDLILVADGFDDAGDLAVQVGPLVVFHVDRRSTAQLAGKLAGVVAADARGEAA